MTAKEYLSELRIMKTALDSKIETYRELVDQATSITIPMSQVKVQSSKSGGGRVDKYMTLAVDLEGDINQDKVEYIDHMHKIICQIQKLHNNLYVQLLFRVYVQFKSIKQVADEMIVSYNYAQHAHKDALAAFEEKYAGEIAEWEGSHSNGKDGEI